MRKLGTIRLVRHAWTPWLPAMALALAGLAVLAHAIPLPERLNVAASTVVYFHDGVPAHVFLSPDDKWRIRLRLSDVDPRYVESLIRIEDRRFRYHGGVDPLAIFRALIQNIRHGRVISGGSTITMQLARVLEPRPRTLGSKLIEAARALQLEWRLSKAEILEAYLQFVPYGRNIEGVEAAALSYFGHRADALSHAEISALLAVPQDPNHRFPAPENHATLRAARDAIAQRLFTAGMLREPERTTDNTGAQLLQLITATGLPETLRPFPRHAAHAAFWLKGRQPRQEHIHTTLDRGLQLLIEHALRAEQDAARRRGIFNASVVLVDHREAEVRALAGNFDFWDDAHGGQIAGFATPRSPGSLLKSFIYALAIDEGMALPDFLVADVPVQYADYTPHNYDGRFHGLVRLEDALSRSLNLPFVNLLQQLRVENFLEALRAMDVASLVPDPGHYGLSAAIGGIEITPLEIATLYATLANDGLHRPIALVKNIERGLPASRRGVDTHAHVFSAGAAYLTRYALALRDRPDFPSRREIARLPPHIHWKTGTSYGHRDAWAAGSGLRHTAVVWMGNFDNSPSAELVGAEAAGPLLFDILEGVADRTQTLLTNLPPSDLKKIRVCAYSGHLPTPSCPHTKTVWALTRNVPTTVCPYHIKRDVDVATGLALTPNCRDGRKYRTEHYTVWPASVRRWLKDQDRRLPQAPALASGCESGQKVAAPRILSPQAGNDVFLVSGMAPDRQELALEAESKIVHARLNWFIDGELLGTVNADERLYWTPVPGRHEILVMDELGQIDKQMLTVHARP